MLVKGALGHARIVTAFLQQQSITNIKYPEKLPAATPDNIFGTNWGVRWMGDTTSHKIVVSCDRLH